MVPLILEKKRSKPMSSPKVVASLFEKKFLTLLRKLSTIVDILYTFEYLTYINLVKRINPVNPVLIYEYSYIMKHILIKELFSVKYSNSCVFQSFQHLFHIINTIYSACNIYHLSLKCFVSQLISHQYTCHVLFC